MSPEKRMKELQQLLEAIKKIATAESGLLKGAGQDSASWKSISKLTERTIALAEQGNKPA
jgi:hypothetical protein